MFTETGSRSEPESVRLASAIFCIDCEVISNSRGDECPACKSHSVVSLAKMLGGSLMEDKVRRIQELRVVLFDVTVTVGLQQVHAKELNSTVEELATVIGPRLARGRASFHVNVEPAASYSRAA